MNEKAKRGLIYIVSRLALVVAVVGIIVGAFFSSMKMSNIYFLLNDALKARLDIILLGSDIEDNQRFFSYNYLQNAEYQDAKENYGIYIITNYGHKLSYGHMFVFPWQTKKTVTVREAVFAINGELDTAQMSKADAMAHGVYNVPEWSNSVYKVKLVLVDGSWQIDSIIRKGDYDYTPPATPSLTKEEIDALRTPTPEPTEAPAVQEGEQSAKISTAIFGEKVNVREGPMTAYDVVAVLKAGDKVTVKEESDGWYLVETEDGITGYVSGYYILFD